MSQAAVDYIRSTTLFESLTDCYGLFELSDENELGRELIYWRLVRPNQPSDIGPLHADSWFWNLGHGKTPHNVDRVKVWVPLHCESGRNGLCVVPDSQKKEWRYHGEFKKGFVKPGDQNYGFMKPVIDEDESELPVILLNTDPGDAVIFHDKLLHRGALNRGGATRVSLEFTMFVKKDTAYHV